MERKSKAKKSTGTKSAGRSVAKRSSASKSSGAKSGGSEKGAHNDIIERLEELHEDMKAFGEQLVEELEYMGDRMQRLEEIFEGLLEHEEMQHEEEDEATEEFKHKSTGTKSKK